MNESTWLERLESRLITMNECVRIYLDLGGNTGPGWLEEEVALTDDLLAEGPES